MICPACGYSGDHDGPAHAYMSASPACWSRYGEILARDYSDAAYWQSHRLLTDAYCGQHTIGTDRRARQSLYIHLAALILHFDCGVGQAGIVDFLRRAAKSGHDFPALEMPQASLSVGLEAVHAAPDAAAHAAEVDRYARSVLDAWQPHHGAFRALIEEIGT